MITHAHSDHIVGIDDLRAYHFLEHKKVPCLVSQENLPSRSKRAFFSLLAGISIWWNTSEQLDFRILPHDFGEMVVEGLRVRYLSSYFRVDP